jgi:hypothetical protein
VRLSVRCCAIVDNNRCAFTSIDSESTHSDRETPLLTRHRLVVQAAASGAVGCRSGDDAGAGGVGWVAGEACRLGIAPVYHQFNISPFRGKIPSFLKNPVTARDARVQFCVLLRRKRPGE